ncbi:unnamed protein product [Pedinophyceae sp. YPF-701]|nr:unnamed protein product [Pedinophyceae sp. YPF-701]
MAQVEAKQLQTMAGARGPEGREDTLRNSGSTSDAAPTKPAKAPSSDSGGSRASRGCLRFSDALAHAIDKAFFKLGGLVGRNPIKVAVGVFVFVLLWLAGLARFTNETRSEKLWIPADSEAQDDKVFAEEQYPSIVRPQVVLMSDTSSTRNVLTKQALDQMFNVDRAVRAVAVPYTGPDGVTTTLTYANRCSTLGGACWVRGILEAFYDPATGDYNPDLWATTEAIVSRLNAAEIRASTGERLSLFDLISEVGVERDAQGRVVSSPAFRMAWFMRSNVGASDDDPESEAWEQGYLDAVELQNTAVEADPSTLKLDYLASRSFSDEFGGAISSDIQLLQAAIIVLFVFATAMLSRWDQGWVGVRVAVAFYGLITIGLGIAFTIGFCSAVGLFYSPLMSVMPFLVLGIGIDDVFVIVNAMDLTDPALPIAERAALALASAGSSITVTSLTDFAAFLIGTNTSLPALRNFNVYTAMGILGIYAFSCTFFLALLCLDERRRNASRADVLCCLTVQPRCCCARPGEGDDGTGAIVRNKTTSYRVMARLGQFLAKPVTKGVVVVAFLAIIGVGISGVPQMQIEADVQDFVPPGSYLTGFVSTNEDLFTSVGVDFDVYFESGVDYSSAGVQADLDDVRNAMLANPQVVNDYVDSWWFSYKAAKSAAQQPVPADAAALYADIKAFLDTGAGKRFQRAVVFVNDNDAAQGIRTSRFSGVFIKAADSQEQVDLMDNARVMVADAVRDGPLEGKAFAYGESFLQWEQYKRVEQEFTTNIALALAMVGVIIFLLLGNPLASLVTYLTVACVVVEIIGYLHYWNVTIDSVVVIMLVLSLGLSVDYSVHIAHAFMSSGGEPNERLVETLATMGTAVLSGGLSTWLAVLLIGASESYVFETFFRALFLCTTLGITHGLIFLPVVLSLVNPKAHAHAEERYEGSVTKTADV